MKKMMLLCSLFLLLQVAVFAQPYADYITEERGDTLVIKNFADYENVANSLTLAISADTVDVPDGRVYLLKDNSWYPVTSNPTSMAGKKIIIMGENNESIKLRKGEDIPAVFSGYTAEGVDAIGNLRSGDDLLVKNIIANAGNPGGSLGWTLFGNEAGTKITVENCILEHNQWVMINPAAGSKVIFKDNYIVNLVGHACRRNGGVIDFFADQDTIIVENNTVINAQGSLFKYRSGYMVNRSIYNHNTFINCAGYSFMNIGNTGKISITNNLFVNSNVQGYQEAFQTEDAGEVDVDNLPMGFVNALADSAGLANGMSFFAHKNATYWSPTWDNYISTLVANEVNFSTDWYSQRIVMNSRTEALFADDETYPLLTNGDWIQDAGDPNFANSADLFTTQLENLKAYALICVDTASTESLPNWRLVNEPVTDLFVFADYPVPVDLSYDNEALVHAGIGGYAIGDLDWFPDQKTYWEMTKNDEYAAIHKTLLVDGIITGVEEQVNVVNNFELAQNYPNPFNPTTIISYTIPEASEVTLKVYDVLGKEVATLVNGFQAANSYKVNFNASSLSTGVYIYKIEAGNFSMTKKMLLLK